MIACFAEMRAAWTSAGSFCGVFIMLDAYGLTLFRHPNGNIVHELCQAGVAFAE
jgi:hypothetical protein